MLIVCPNCTTSYQVQSASLGASGRSVRCARCRTVWFAVPTADTPAEMPTKGAAAQPADNGGGFPRAGDEWGADAEADAAAGWPDVNDDAWGKAEAQPADATSWPEEAADAVPGQPEAMAAVESPSLVPAADAAVSQAQPDSGGGGKEAAEENIETFAARRARLAEQGRRQLRSRGLLALIAVLIAIVASLVLWRSSVVAALPQTASFFRAIGMPVNLRGLAFDNVGSKKEAQDGATILVVEGTIANTMRAAIEVPRLRFAIRNQAGHEVYVWTALPASPILGPGESLQFHSRLASPPAEGRDVVVRFFTKRDLPATAR